MSELWAIAMGDRVVEGTDGQSAYRAWAALYRQQGSVRGIHDYIDHMRRNGYSAVRLRYEIVERDWDGKGTDHA